MDLGDTLLALIGFLGSALFAGLVAMIKRWMVSIEDGIENLHKKFDNGFEQLPNELGKIFILKEQHIQVHNNIKNQLERIVTICNQHDARLIELEKRLPK